MATPAIRGFFGWRGGQGGFSPHSHPLHGQGQVVVQVQPTPLTLQQRSFSITASAEDLFSSVMAFPLFYHPAGWR
jgi:hypothetical protein